MWVSRRRLDYSSYFGPPDQAICIQEETGENCVRTFVSQGYELYDGEINIGPPYDLYYSSRRTLPTTYHLLRVSQSQYQAFGPLSGTSVGVSGDDVRSVQSVGHYRVRIDSDKKGCDIMACCTLPGGEILLVDQWNKRLKKLDSAYNVTSVFYLSGGPFGVCYIGNNVAVVTVGSQLVYVDVSSMTVTKTVKIDHRCESITCHNDKLYVMSNDTVYMYTLDGNNGTLFTSQKSSICVFKSIAVSGDGKKIYITDKDRLITIDSFGNLLSTLSLPAAGDVAVAVDNRGNVWVCGFKNNKLYQVSSNGARLLGTVSVDKLSTRAMCYDIDRSSLISAGLNDNIQIIRLD